MREAISRLGAVFLKPCAGRGERERKCLQQWQKHSAWDCRFHLSEENPGVACVLSCRWASPGNSPLAESPDGKVRLLFDGYLLNNAELAAELPLDERKPHSESDSGLLLQLYLQKGDSFVENANGWYAVVVVDLRASRAVLATDRFGMHQLYYCETDQGLFVATEARSLFKLAGCSAELDLNGLADYLAYRGILNDRTLFRGIQRMPPAALWRFDGKTCRKGRHFDFRSLVPSRSHRESPASIQLVEDTFARMMPRYLARPEELSLSLTGGLDTRVIASFLDRAVASHTYGFNPKSLDNIVAKKVAKALQSQHRFMAVTEDFFRGFHDLARDTMCVSDGMGHVSDAAMLFVVDQHDSSVRRILTGKYGTQIARGVSSLAFGGRLMYVLDALHPDLRDRLKEMAQASLEGSLSRLGSGLAQMDRQLLFTLLEECRRLWGGQLSMERTRVTHTTPYVDNDMVPLMFALSEEMRQGSSLQLNLVRRRRADLARLPTNRGALALADSMLARLSAWRYRVLYKLNNIANARQLPPRLRTDRLPFAKLGTRQDRTWFRGELSNFVREILLDHRSLARGLFDKTAVERAVADHLGRKADRSHELRKMLSLELTHRIFFDDANGGAFSA